MVRHQSFRPDQDINLIVSEDKRFNLPKKFKEFRREQILLAEKAAELFMDGADVVILEATVGFGKSMFAELVRQLLKTRMLMVVPRIDLQRQFLESFPYSQLLQGRSNFPTPGPGGHKNFPKITCADCRENYFCKKSPCHYKASKNRFITADVGVTNSSYFMAAANHLGMFDPLHNHKNLTQDEIEQRNKKASRAWVDDYLTTFDECCTLEDIILNFVSSSVTISQLEKITKDVNLDIKLKIPSPPVHKFDTWFSWLGQIIKILEQCLDKFGEPRSADIEEVRWFVRVQKLLLSLRMVKEDWIYDPERQESKIGRKTGQAWRVSFKPIVVGDLGHQYLWRHCGKTLCMSGSIINLKVWSEDETGLAQCGKRIEYLQYDSEWDRRNALIHRVPGIKMVKQKRSEPWPSQPFWTEYISNIVFLISKYENERTLIHAVSHELARDIGEELVKIFGPEKIIVDSGDYEKVSKDDSPEEIEAKMSKNTHLKRYLETPGSVLISAKLGRGTDLPGSKCRNIILAKMPFPYLGDRRIQAKLKNTELGELWYMVKTVREIHQYVGRGRRYKDDWVRVWCVDDCFSQVESMRGLLHDSFSKTIRQPGDYMSKYPPLQELETP